MGQDYADNQHSCEERKACSWTLKCNVLCFMGMELYIHVQLHVRKHIFNNLIYVGYLMVLPSCFWP